MRLFNDSDYLKGFTDSQIWWLFLSGIFSRLNAIQYKDLDILLPKNEVLVNSYDIFNIEQALKKRNTIHIICWDGLESFYSLMPLIKSISIERIKIHYVGQFKNAWRGIPFISTPLFLDSPEEIDCNLKILKHKFPSSYKKIILRHALMIPKNLSRAPLMAKKYYLDKKNFLCFFGAIKPDMNYLTKCAEIFDLDKNKLNRYFENSNSLGSIIERIEGALSLGHGINLGNNSLLLKIRHIEFVNYVLRNSVISYLRQSNANILTADYYSGQQFNAYESFGGILNCHLDFGTKLGFDQNYPRSADLLALRKKSISIRLSEENFETCNAQDLFGPIESALNTYIY